VRERRLPRGSPAAPARSPRRRRAGTARAASSFAACSPGAGPIALELPELAGDDRHAQGDEFAGEEPAAQGEQLAGEEPADLVDSLVRIAGADLDPGRPGLPRLVAPGASCEGRSAAKKKRGGAPWPRGTSNCSRGLVLLRLSRESGTGLPSQSGARLQTWAGSPAEPPRDRHGNAELGRPGSFFFRCSFSRRGPGRARVARAGRRRSPRPGRRVRRRGPAGEPGSAGQCSILDSDKYTPCARGPRPPGRPGRAVRRRDLPPARTPVPSGTFNDQYLCPPPEPRGSGGGEAHRRGGRWGQVAPRGAVPSRSALEPAAGASCPSLGATAATSAANDLEPPRPVVPGRHLPRRSHAGPRAPVRRPAPGRPERRALARRSCRRRRAGRRPGRGLRMSPVLARAHSPRQGPRPHARRRPRVRPRRPRPLTKAPTFPPRPRPSRILAAGPVWRTRQRTRALSPPGRRSAPGCREARAICAAARREPGRFAVRGGGVFSRRLTRNSPGQPSNWALNLTRRASRPFVAVSGWAPRCGPPDDPAPRTASPRARARRRRIDLRPPLRARLSAPFASLPGAHLRRPLASVGSSRRPRLPRPGPGKVPGRGKRRHGRVSPSPGTARPSHGSGRPAPTSPSLMSFAHSASQARSEARVGVGLRPTIS
jgi:hypothetical protein